MKKKELISHTLTAITMMPSQDTQHDHRDEIIRDEISLNVYDDPSAAISSNYAEQLDEEEQQSFRNFKFTRQEKSNLIKLSIMILMVVVFFVAELVVGYVGKSLAMVSDAFHMLSDGISLIIGLVAIIVCSSVVHIISLLVKSVFFVTNFVS